MSIKILVNDGISNNAVDILKKQGFIVCVEKVEQSKLIEIINTQQYNVLLVRSATKVTKEIIDQCPSLQLIGRGGVGMDNIEVEYAISKGLKVFNTPAVASQAVAELAMTYIFNISRQLSNVDKEMKIFGTTKFSELKKKYGKGTELRGKTLGIFGFGRIGQSLAKYALGSGMKVIACELSRTPNTLEIDLGIEGINSKIKITTTSIDNVLTQSDFISIHIPASKDGIPVFGKSEFEKMKSTAALINLSRGGVVDEDALIESLNNNKIAFAGVDVFVNEPTPRKDLLSTKNIFLTPHIGAATIEAQQKIHLKLVNTIISHYKK